MLQWSLWALCFDHFCINGTYCTNISVSIDLTWTTELQTLSSSRYRVNLEKYDNSLFVIGGNSHNGIIRISIDDLNTSYNEDLRHNSQWSTDSQYGSVTEIQEPNIQIDSLLYLVAGYVYRV